MSVQIHRECSTWVLMVSYLNQLCFESLNYTKRNWYFDPCFSLAKATVGKMLFRSRKRFSTTYAIVSFVCVFFSRPFHENFKFLKNCSYDFHEILHSQSTPKGAPVCAKASKSYDWNVRNIAKTSPKMAKKQPFFNCFRFFQKLSKRCERNFLQSFSTPYFGSLCAISSNSYDWDSSESKGKIPKPFSLPHMRLLLIRFLRKTGQFQFPISEIQ